MPTTTVTGSLTAVVSGEGALAKYNELLGRVQTIDIITNILGNEPELTITFDIDQTIED